MKLMWPWVLSVASVLPSLSHASDVLVDSTHETGIFSIALSGGSSSSGLLNGNGSYSSYTYTNFGAEFDFRLWRTGEAQFRFFGSHLIGTGKSTDDGAAQIKTQETIFGFKMSVNSYLYLAVGAGRGQVTLSSLDVQSDLSINHFLTRSSIGLQFPLTDSVLIGLEVSYRNGPIKRSENSSLSENSHFEGAGALLKFIWSPPSITNNYSTK